MIRIIIILIIIITLIPSKIERAEEFLANFRELIEEGEYPYNTASGNYAWCIPYNDETKHLVGTNDEAPDFYKYWEE